MNVVVLIRTQLFITISSCSCRKVSPGQRINVTLYEFSSSSPVTSSAPFHRANKDESRQRSAATGSGTASSSSSSSTRGRLQSSSMPYGRLRERNSRRSSIEITAEIARPYGGLAAGRETDGESEENVDDNSSANVHQREWHVLTTETSAVEVVIYEVPGRDNFLLTFAG